MTIRYAGICFGLAAVLLLATSDAAAAQETLAVPSTRPSILGFSYGWSGGIDLATEGAVRMREHPRVNAVRPRGGAAAAGVAVGDVVLTVDGRDARNPAALRDVRPGSTITLVLRRGSDRRRVVLRVDRPEGP